MSAEFYGPEEPTGEIEQYLRVIANGQEGYLVLWTLRNRAHTHFRTDQLAHAAAFAAAAAAAREDVYVRCNVQGSETGTKVDTVAALTAVTVDFDLAGPGHKAAALPTTEDEFDRLLVECGVPDPTVVLRTGGGLLGVWALDTPLQLHTQAERDRAKALSKGFQARLRTAAKEAGYHLDATADLVRAVRIPALRNWKEAYGPDGAPVTVKAWGGGRLTVAELERIAAEARTPARTKSVRSISAGPRESSGRTPTWASIYNGCDALRAWADTQDGLAEPQWYALASVVGRCEGGRAIFHQLSEHDHRYDSRETDEKLDHALEASGPRLCSSIADLAGDCSACPSAGRIQSPINLGYADPAVALLARQWAYIADRDSFVDLKSLEEEQA